jgi:hypothetical protein
MKYTDFIVYGEFTEPRHGACFIVVRMPSGRVPWNTKIVPAINRLVKQWMREPEKFGRRWWVDGGALGIWSNKKFTRYKWNSTKLVEVK